MAHLCTIHVNTCDSVEHWNRYGGLKYCKDKHSHLFSQQCGILPTHFWNYPRMWCTEYSYSVIYSYFHVSFFASFAEVIYLLLFKVLVLAFLLDKQLLLFVCQDSPGSADICLLDKGFCDPSTFSILHTGKLFFEAVFILRKSHLLILVFTYRRLVQLLLCLVLGSSCFGFVLTCFPMTLASVWLVFNRLQAGRKGGGLTHIFSPV